LLNSPRSRSSLELPALHSQVDGAAFDHVEAGLQGIGPFILFDDSIQLPLQRFGHPPQHHRFEAPFDRGPVLGAGQDGAIGGIRHVGEDQGLRLVADFLNRGSGPSGEFRQNVVVGSRPGGPHRHLPFLDQPMEVLQGHPQPAQARLHSRQQSAGVQAIGIPLRCGRHHLPEIGQERPRRLQIPCRQALAGGIEQFVRIGARPGIGRHHTGPERNENGEEKRITGRTAAYHLVHR
jgi:hypothetical protein